MLQNILQLGLQADLLAKPDEWLNAHRHKLENDITRLTDELTPIVQAQEIKRQLNAKTITTILHNSEIIVMLQIP